MQSQRRGVPGGARAAAEPKAPAGRRDPDINRERLIYCLTSLVGHRTVAKLRNNISYEGIFHSCSLDGDYSITLKSARLLPSGGGKAGEVIRTLIIPGKDFLQVSASDVPPPAGAHEAPQHARGFLTDAEIAEQRGDAPVGERELVVWQPPEGETALELAGGLGDVRSTGQWDQFQTNERMYGIASTFDEELYTTKLDPASIPREKREEAERIAREIQSGRMASEAEGCLEGEAEDEELAYSAVAGTGAYRRKDITGNGAAASSSKARGTGRCDPASSSTAPLTELSVMPHQGGHMALTKEHLNQHEALAGDSYAREHRTKRALITAHSPMRSPNISEMKGINALNLEPALPKLDDKTRNDWINFKQSQTRSSGKSQQGHALKSEFQESLALIQKREASKQAAEANGAESRHHTTVASPSTPVGAKAEGGSEPSRFGGAGEMARPSFLNPNAKEFSFNPGAATFTPTNAMQGSSSSQSKVPMPAASATAATSSSTPADAGGTSGPLFVAQNVNPDILRRSLTYFLDRMRESIAFENTEVCSSEWPGAVGPSFREVLGQPNPAHQLPQIPGMPGGPCPGATGSWQSQGQGHGPMQPSGGTVAGPGGQMIPQGAFMMPANMTAGQGQQQGTAMGYPQMYSAQGPPQQGNQGMQQQHMPQQPQPQQQPPQQQQQQPMAFQQQLGQSQGMTMQGVACQGGTGALAAMPKFGAQMVMMPAGQFAPQGFIPQQGQMLPQGQMMHQSQMMQPGAFHMQRGGQLGGPGSGGHPQMGGHDG